MHRLCGVCEELKGGQCPSGHWEHELERGHDRKWDHPPKGGGAEVKHKGSAHEMWVQIHFAWLVEYLNYLQKKKKISTLGRAGLHTPQLGQIQTFMLLASPQNSIWKARETNWTDCWAFCFCRSVETHNAILKVFEIANIVVRVESWSHGGTYSRWTWELNSPS